MDWSHPAKEYLPKHVTEGKIEGMTEMT